MYKPETPKESDNTFKFGIAMVVILLLAILVLIGKGFGWFQNAMTTGALIMWIGWCSIVTIVTGYLFYRVLTKKKKNEPEPYSEYD